MLKEKNPVLRTVNINLWVKMRARFHVALCTLVLPYKIGDVIYLTQAGTDTNRHTQIHTHTHTHSPLPPDNTDRSMSKGQWRSLLLITVISWILAYLVFFSLLYLLFSAQNGHLWPVGISLDCLPSLLW